jgi:sulfur-oxidizing protein SoxZ
MTDPMRIRATLKDDIVDVKILIGHEMETGLRQDASGALIPAHYISKVTASYRGKAVLVGEWGPAVSKNPFLAFRFKGGDRGEKVTITWVDNLGDTRTDEGVIT